MQRAPDFPGDACAIGTALLTGMLVAMFYIQKQLTGERTNDLEIVRTPYRVIGGVVLVVMLAFVLTKLASAGLIFAIVVGALMPPLQGLIIDLGSVAGMSATRFSFFLPALCFVVIATYGWRSIRRRMQLRSNPAFEVPK